MGKDTKISKKRKKIECDKEEDNIDIREIENVEEILLPKKKKRKDKCGETNQVESAAIDCDNTISDEVSANKSKKKKRRHSNSENITKNDKKVLKIGKKKKLKANNEIETLEDDKFDKKHKNTDDVSAKRSKEKKRRHSDSVNMTNDVSLCTEHLVSNDDKKVLRIGKKKKRKPNNETQIFEDDKFDKKHKKKKHKKNNFDKDTDSWKSDINLDDNLERKKKKKKYKESDNEMKRNKSISDPPESLIDEENSKIKRKSNKKKKKKHKENNGCDTEFSQNFSDSNDQHKTSTKTKKKKNKDKHRKDSNEIDDYRTTSESNIRPNEKEDIKQPDQIHDSEKSGQWGTAFNENKDKQNKFLRLMGGFKKGMDEQTSKSLEFANFAMDQSTEQTFHKNLEQQYDKAMTSNLQRGVGLGFQPPPDAGKKFYIDKVASKSVKFGD